MRAWRTRRRASSSASFSLMYNNGCSGSNQMFPKTMVFGGNAALRVSVRHAKHVRSAHRWFMVRRLGKLQCQRSLGFMLPDVPRRGWTNFASSLGHIVNNVCLFGFVCMTSFNASEVLRDSDIRRCCLTRGCV